MFYGLWSEINVVKDGDEVHELQNVRQQEVKTPIMLATSSTSRMITT